MSVLTNIERKTIKGRILLAAVTLALIAGGLTMIYPFLLMVSGAMRSPMDVAQMKLVPGYLIDQTVLARKFLEYKYNQSTMTMNEHRGYQDFSFAAATVPDHVVQKRLADLEAFVAEEQIPDHWQVLGGTQMYRRTGGPNKDRFTKGARQLYNGDIEALHEETGIIIATWRELDFRMPDWASRRYDITPSRYYQAYNELMHQRPLAERAMVSLTGHYIADVINPVYGLVTVDAYNAAHKEQIRSMGQITLSRTCPPAELGKTRDEWIVYVREMLSSSFIRTTELAGRWQQFLRGKYVDVAALNGAWGSSCASFESVPLPGDREGLSSAVRSDYSSYLQTLPPESLRLVGPEFAWQDWLKNRYGSLDALNAVHETHHQDWGAVRIPLADAELAYVQANQGMLRRQFATSNFSNVIDEVMLQGRPLLNTVVYVVLALVLTLTLQPLAAYSLSRFNPPGTWRIILIFMATMAFPPMVGMIPEFLILRKLSLLNTFVALTLPIIVNGYLVFLLKGFFDSLPPHLYEAALIDGASELRMFWEITMALSKPILAVVALETFNVAWMAFMYPMLVCPDQSMHVLAVWLYQFQQHATTSAVFAAILVTSIPTLLLFVFTQRTIMRGIAVPAEK